MVTLSRLVILCKRRLEDQPETLGLVVRRRWRDQAALDTTEYAELGGVENTARYTPTLLLSRVSALEHESSFVI